jgi:hypothetical protein
MAGFMEAWGKSVKTHDKLIKSLPRLAKRTEESLQKISSNLRKIRELSEEVGKFAANLASIEYPTEIPEGAASSAAIDTIARMLDLPRHPMKRDEVSFHRSRLQAILRLQQNNVAEVSNLASTIRQRRDCLKKIVSFYSKSSKRARVVQKAQRSPGAVKRSKHR